MSLLQVLLKLLGTLLWEDLMQSHTDGVHFLLPDRVFLLPAGFEVHIDLVLWDGACHQLSVATKDITSFGFHTDTVTLETVSHVRPVLFLGRHDIEGFADDGNTNNCEHYCDKHVARHYFIIVEFTHDGFLILVVV